MPVALWRTILKEEEKEEKYLKEKDKKEGEW